MTDTGSFQGIIALLLVAGASFFSTAFILIFYTLKRKVVHSFSFDLIIMLCVSDCVYAAIGFFRAIWMLFERDAELGSIACYIQGMAVTTSSVSSFMCTASISYALYCSLVLQRPIYRQKSAFKLFWKINYLIPFTFAIIIASCSYYGPVKPYPGTLCFIHGANQLQTQMFFLFFYYMPFFCALIIDTILISKIIIYYKKQQHNLPSCTANEISKLAFFPLILFLCWLPVIIFRVLLFFGISSDQLIEIGHISDNIIGFLDVIFYVMISLDPLKCFGSKSNSESFLDSSINQSHIVVQQPEENKYPQYSQPFQINKERSNITENEDPQSEFNKNNDLSQIFLKAIIENNSPRNLLSNY